MLDLIGVIVIVALAALFLGRSLYRTMTGNNDGCAGCDPTGCQSCSGCRSLQGLFRASEAPNGKESAAGVRRGARARGS